MTTNNVFLTGLTFGVEIRDVRMPSSVRSNSDESVMMSCDYDVSDEEAAAMDVKWYHERDPQPFFQWIPGRSEPQVLGELFRGKIDLDFQVRVVTS